MKTTNKKKIAALAKGAGSVVAISGRSREASRVSGVRVPVAGSAFAHYLGFVGLRMTRAMEKALPDGSGRAAG